MKKISMLAALFLASNAYAGDVTGSFLESLGNFYPTTKFIDYSQERWELAACEGFGSFLAGKYGIKDMGAVRVFTFAGPITEKEFWKNTGRFKREVVNFGFGQEKVSLVKAEKAPYPFQQLAAPKNFEKTRFFVGLANSAAKPVLCSAVFYE